MIPEISDTCMFLNTAKEIWIAVEQTYSKAKDAAQVYDVKVKIVAAKQGNKTVTEYANQLKSLWMELDHYRVIKTQCSADVAVLKGVYDFLVGLNPEFDQIRIQILGRQELPSLNEVVAMVRSEESRRNLMLDTPTIESSAMVAEHIKRDPRNVEKRKDGLWCTYCNKASHTREKCWKLHGKSLSREWSKKGESSWKSGHTHVAVAEHSEENKPDSTSLN